MALIGLGVGPMLSGLQIALQRTRRAGRDRRGDGHAAAPAPGRRVRRAGGAGDGLRRRAARAATGGERHRALSVFAVALAGAAVAAVALLSLPRRGDALRGDARAGVRPAQRARMRLLRGLCSTSASPSASSTGGT